MILSTLIQKNGLQQFATVTAAKTATFKILAVETVAAVASVTVANPEIEKTTIADLPDSQLIELNPEPIDEMWYIDDRRYCVQCANLTSGRCLAAWRGEIEAARHYRPVDDSPRRCEGYMPTSNDPDQRSGSERWSGLSKEKHAKYK